MVPATHRRRTVIAFWVSVPVLSVHTTCAQPSVSTAGSRRTSALRRAIRVVPRASTIVVIAGSPSGMAATARATATRNIVRGLCAPNSQPARKTTAEATTQPMTMSLPNLSSCFSSGVSSSSTSASMPAIEPSSVFMPVLHTTPRARPRVTRVPMKAMFTRSASPTAGSRSSVASFCTGTDSPVKAASSTSRSAVVHRRRSAATLSPSSRRITSPGTTVADGSSDTCPPRTTRATGEVMSRSAASALAAFFSFTRPRIAFRITMRRIAMPSPKRARKDASGSGAMIDRTVAITAAPSSASTVESDTWARTRDRSDGGAFSVSLFGPRRARRLSASAGSRPASSDDSQYFATDAGGTAWKARRSGWLGCAGMDTWTLTPSRSASTARAGMLMERRGSAMWSGF